MTTFETFKKSIYNPVFYQNAVTTPLSDIVRYYIKFSFFLSVVMTVYLGIALVPQGIRFVKERAPEMIKNYFPAELTIHIENGESSVNVPEPYIAKGKDSNHAPLREQGLENMLVIDTKNDFDINRFEEYKTFALLTKNQIVTKNNKGSFWGDITIQNLRTFPTMDVNQDSLLSWVEKVRAKLGYIILGGALVTFIVIALGYFVYLIPLLLFTFIPFFIAWLKKAPLSYAGAYRMSLYAIVPALALKTLLNLFGIFFLPSYFTLLVFMLIIALNMKEVEAPTLFENK